MRRMGGLRRYLPITYAVVLIGAFANAGFPPLAGFFSKDTIIEALHASQRAGSTIAYAAALAGVFVGALYSFRLVFFAFHGKERFSTGRQRHGHDAGDDHGSRDDHGHAGRPHESPAVVTVPLLLLAIPSVAAGWLIGTVVYGSYFGDAVFVAASHDWIAGMAKAYHGVVPMMLHGLATLPFWLAVAGLATAWYCYILRPELPAILRQRFSGPVRILENKYGFDAFNQWFFASGAVALGTRLWKIGDVMLIDGLMVNGSARLVGWFAGVVRWLQSGYIYHYAFSMIMGVFVLLTLFGLALAR